MTSEKAKWKKLFHSPSVLMWLAIWLVASYMLMRIWKDTPFPLGSVMPY
jgi:hypothetical protein